MGRETGLVSVLLTETGLPFYIDIIDRNHTVNYNKCWVKVWLLTIDSQILKVCSVIKLLLMVVEKCLRM